MSHEPVPQLSRSPLLRCAPPLSPPCCSGIGIHHAGMLRSDRNLVERLFGEGLIKVGRELFVSLQRRIYTVLQEPVRCFFF